MAVMPVEKYKPFQPIDLPDRQWPTKSINKCPVWCSVDLRDGNQALIEPMGPERKLRMFKTLCRMGFKEIEVGFPAASETDFAFVRQIIDEDLVPEDVTIQVLTQSRDELIRRTFDSIRGSKKAIVHLYNSTSTTQRRVVFREDRAGVKKIAADGARLIKELIPSVPETQVRVQYSPESFTQTEMDFAKAICEAVMDVWRPTPDNRVIINLPATVEVATPNVYADQIEWFDRNVKDREAIVLSVHPHNDRGTGVAATELALMAGAERVEGTLFGNGERTGNVDIVTLALNMYTQGVDPGLDIGDINELVRAVEYCNQLPVHPRHPYAGELVFTAFSGSHQDAINKGFQAMRRSNSGIWDIPYLPIDPQDIGRSYEAVIRINSQSGKGGISYVMEKDYGLQLPRRLQIEFSHAVQKIADATGEELDSQKIWRCFESEYLEQPQGRFRLVEYRTEPEHDDGERRELWATLTDGGREVRMHGSGTGPIDAFVQALNGISGLGLEVVDYREHAVGAGANATAVSYLEVKDASGASTFGVGMHKNIVTASLRAVLGAANRLARPAAVAA